MGRTTSSATTSDQSALSEEEQIVRNYNRGCAFEELTKATHEGRRFLVDKFGVFTYPVFPMHSSKPYLIIEVLDGVKIEVHDAIGFPTNELIAEIMLLKG